MVPVPPPTATSASACDDGVAGDADAGCDRHRDMAVGGRRVAFGQQSDTQAAGPLDAAADRLHDPLPAAADYGQAEPGQEFAEPLGGAELRRAGRARADDADRHAAPRAAVALQPGHRVENRNRRAPRPARGCLPGARPRLEATPVAAPQAPRRPIEPKRHDAPSYGVPAMPFQPPMAGAASREPG